MRIPSYQKLAQCFDKSQSPVLQQVRSADGAEAAMRTLLKGLAGKQFASDNALKKKVENLATQFLQQVPSISIAGRQGGRQTIQFQFPGPRTQFMLGGPNVLPKRILEMVAQCIGARGDL